MKDQEDSMKAEPLEPTPDELDRIKWNDYMR